MKSLDFSYFVNALCGAGIVIVIANGFVPMFGLSPFVLLATFISFPIITILSEKIAEADRRDRRRLKESYKRLDRGSRERAIRELEGQKHKALPVKGAGAETSTGCVLTDQIFEAARCKGIDPEDVIKPEHECEESDG